MIASVSPVLASTTLTRITGDCEQPLERLHNHVAGSKNEVARATEVLAVRRYATPRPLGGEYDRNVGTPRPNGLHNARRLYQTQASVPFNQSESGLGFAG